MSDKCFCHFNGYEVKDAKARKKIADLDNYVTPQMYGAKADGVTDDTEAIQSAINENSNVLVPEGTYAVHGTILLTGGKTLKLQNKAVLNKPLASGNTDPVVWIKGYYNSLLGSGMMNGKITADVATPYGVLLIGDKGVDATPEDALYNTICDIGVVGAKYGGNSEGDPIRAVYICSADGYTKAVFFNTLQNMYIGNANDGLYLLGSANANIIDNIQFRGVGNEKRLNGSAIHLERVDDRIYPLENMITNAFHHQSKNAVTLFIDGGTLNNSIHHIVCEQSGDTALGIKVADGEKKSSGNDISIIDNCYGGNIVPDHFYENNTLRRRGFSASRATMTTLLQRINNGTHVRERTFAISNFTDGSHVKVLTVDTQTLIRGHSLVVDLDITTKGPKANAKLWGAYAKARYHIVGDASGKVSVKTKYAFSDYDLLNEPIIDGNKVIFSVKFPYFTGTITNNAVYCDYKLYGNSEKWFVTEHTTFETVTDPVRVLSCAMQTTYNGATDGRPSPAIKGQLYFDTTLGKPIWYNGTAWVDATGATV